MIAARLAGFAWDAWRAERGGAAAIARRREARLADLIRFARARSPFYRELYRDLPADARELPRLPPVTKPQLMSNFDGWVTDPAVTWQGVAAFLADRTLVGQRYLGRYMVMTTSGITGQRGVFLHDVRAVTLHRALTLLRGWRPRVTRQSLWPILRQGNRVAVLATTGGHYGGATIFEAARRDHPWPFDRIRVLSVLRPLPDLVGELNDFQPAHLIGYPTALALLAREQRAGRLWIRPAVVGSGGDWLAPAAQREIAAAFAGPVRQNYGASEFPPLAWDCPRGELHVSIDWAVLEPVDEAYRPVPSGQPSHSVLLTNLANRVQPLIRYELGDTVTLDPVPCPCGNPFPTVRVHGRRDETVWLGTADGRTVPLLPNALLRLTNEGPGVRLAQVVQTGPTTLSVRLDVEPTADDAEVWRGLERSLKAHLTAHALPHVAVERAPGLPVRDPASGKLRRVLTDLGGCQR